MSLELPKSLLSFEVILMFLILPLIGMSIPWLLNFFENIPRKTIFAGYLFCVVISFVIWIGCRTIFVKLRSFAQPRYSYSKFLLVYTITIIAYSFGLSYLSFFVLFQGLLNIDKDVFALSILAVLLALLISAIYEIMMLYDQNKFERIEKENLKREKLVTEINKLKSKIEPHFLFNSLSTLQNLIIENKAAANEFNRILSELYQDLLVLSEKDYVSLDRELNLMYKYYYLNSIRFPDALKLSVMLHDFNLENILIPPFSLQMLLENAIKHNTFSSQNPLEIKVTIESDFLVFCNKKATVATDVHSTKTGLKVLAELFLLQLHKEIEVQNNDKIFCVRLPLKKNQKYVCIDS